jgi:hypothetical protein
LENAVSKPKRDEHRDGDDCAGKNKNCKDDAQSYSHSPPSL